MNGSAPENESQARADAENFVGRLHSARMNGRLDAMCSLFLPVGCFKIAGASTGKPISIQADDLDSLTPWLSMMIKTFRLSRYELKSLIVDPPKIAAHWRADIFSRITGISTSTELIDLLEIRDGRIAAYTEFFMPDTIKPSLTPKGPPFEA